MEKPDQSFFTYSNESRRIEFTSLTGEKWCYHISTEEHLIDSICPICGNYMVVGHGYMDSWRNCISCEEDTLRMSIKDYIKNTRENLKTNLRELKELKKTVVKEKLTIKILKEKLK